MRMSFGPHDALIGLAAVAALWIAFRTRALGDVRLLVPYEPSKPLATLVDERIVFRFCRFDHLPRRSRIPPRILLALLLLAVSAPLLYLLLPVEHDWSAFLARLALWLGFLAFVAGPTAFLWTGVLLLPAVAAAIWTKGDPRFMGIAGGAWIGFVAGKALALNYLHHLQRLRLQRGFLARLKAVFLWTVPLSVLYEVVRHFWSEVDLARLPGPKFPLLLVGFGLGMNLVFWLVPLFRRMLERSSQFAAAGLNNLLRQRHDRQAQGFIHAYLGSKGEWVPFGAGQIFTLVVVTMVLATNAIRESADTLVQAGVFVPTFRVGTILEATTWLPTIANVFFLAILIRTPKAATAESVRLMMRCESEPEVAVTCETDGVEFRIREVAKPEPS
jgi:hypothetical protein